MHDYRNSAADGQGSSGLHFNHSDPNDFIDIINTSIHGNEGNNLLAEFYIGGGVNISYSNVGGGFASIEYTDSYQGTVNWGTGNVDVEPKFINSEENNFHLLASSMLINGGHPDSLDSDGTATDIGAYPYLNSFSGPVWQYLLREMILLELVRKKHHLNQFKQQLTFPKVEIVLLWQKVLF